MKDIITVLITLILSGCGYSDMNKAKAIVWAEQMCSNHSEVYSVHANTLKSAWAYCKDGSKFHNSNITNFTHPDVAKHLPTKE